MKRSETTMFFMYCGGYEFDSHITHLDIIIHFDNI